MVSRSTDAPVLLGDHIPTADQRVVLRGLDWAAYDSLLELRGERSSPRIAFIDGVAELMTPSRDHEHITSVIACLLQAYCSELDVPWSTYRNWTLRRPTEESGLEPDDCFVFGDQPELRDTPDLAIEVVWTSGGLDKLEIYRRLGVAEVWQWRRDAIAVYVLGPSGYERRDRSARFPDFDLELVSRLVDVSPTSAALAQFRARQRR